MFEQPRMDLGAQARAPYRAMIAFDDSIELDPALRELVRVRASLLNGCAYCVDMHTKDARAAGETEQRLYALATWHEAPFFSERERAFLEQMATKLGVALNNITQYNEIRLLAEQLRQRSEEITRKNVELERPSLPS